MDTNQRNIMIGITLVIVLVLADGWYMSSVTAAAPASAHAPASSGAK